MTLTARMHDVVVEAPDGASALALEYRLAQLCPVTIARDNAWVVDFDGIESPEQIENEVRSWLAEIGAESTLMRVDDRLVRVEARAAKPQRRGTHRDFSG